MTKFATGDRVKVIGDNITGMVIYDDGRHVIIEDDDAETEDNRLEFLASDLELLHTNVIKFYTRTGRFDEWTERNVDLEEFASEVQYYVEMGYYIKIDRQVT